MILVTGGTGLIGSHLLYSLLQSEASVKAIRRNKQASEKTLKVFSYYSSKAQELFDKIIWIDADITDVGSLLDAFEDTSEVFHCAGYVNFDASQLDKLMQINHQGTANVVNACLEKQIKKLYYISSVAALGDPILGEAVSEECDWQIKDSNSAYSASKFKAEMEVFRGKAEGLDVCIVNPTVVIGPGEWTTGSSALFQTVWNGLKYYTEGGVGVVDVKDVVSILLELRKRQIMNEKFILVSENLTYKELFILIADSLGRARPNKRLTTLLAGLAWRAEKLRCLFSRSAPLVSKHSMQSCFIAKKYSAEKLNNAFQFEYISAKQSINDTSKLFLQDHLANQN